MPTITDQGNLQSSPTPSETTFHIDFWPFFWTSFLWVWFGGLILAFILGGLLIILIPHTGSAQPANIPSLLKIIGGLALYAAITAAILGFLSRFAPIKVGQKEVQGLNAWGSKATMRWDEMERVRHFDTLQAICVYSSQKKGGLWLPLVLSQQKQFENLVCELVPPGNPVPQFFKEQEQREAQISK